MIRPVSIRTAAIASAVALGAAVVASSVVWGRRVQARNLDVKLGAAPFVGRWTWHATWALLPAVIVCALIVALGPSVSQRARFAWLMIGTGVAGALVALLLALGDGGSGLLAPVVHRTEYLANVDRLPPAHEMLRVFGTRHFLVNWSVHLKGHPPGFVLLLKAARHIGLGRPWHAAALSYVGIVGIGVGVVATIRSLGDEVSARRVAPFLAVAPFAVWLGTSADALYAGVFACGVAAVASTSRSRPRRLVANAAGGMLLGATLFLTYGAATLLPLPAVALLLAARRVRSDPSVGALLRAALPSIGAAAAGFALPFLAFRAAGFWWFDGLRTTQGLYWEGTAKFRPWRYFLVGNVGVLLGAIGIAAAAGAAAVAVERRRFRVPATLVAVTAFCVLGADASQYSKGEVERIWLLFMPWLLVGAAALRRPRVWLALQALTALGFQALLVSKW